jgi:hypothetical protein
MNDIRIKLEDLKKEKANNSINILTQVIDNLEKYYNTSKNLIENYNPRNSNYYIIMNIKSFIDYNKIIIQDINQILNEKNIEIKNNYISNIYKNMIIDSEFILKYNLNEPGVLKLFGEPFVQRNKNCFQLIINQQNYELNSYLNIIDANTKEQSNRGKIRT